MKNLEDLEIYKIIFKLRSAIANRTDTGVLILQTFEQINEHFNKVQHGENLRKLRKLLSFRANSNTKYSVFILKNSANLYDVFYVDDALPLPGGIKNEEDLINSLTKNLKVESYVVEDVSLAEVRMFFNALYIYDRNELERTEYPETTSLPNCYHNIYSLEELPQAYDYVCSQNFVVEREVIPCDFNYLNSFKTAANFADIFDEITSSRFAGTPIRVLK